jgi:hypothetical protein
MSTLSKGAGIAARPGPITLNRGSNRRHKMMGRARLYANRTHGNYVKSQVATILKDEARDARGKWTAAQANTYTAVNHLEEGQHHLAEAGKVARTFGSDHPGVKHHTDLAIMHGRLAQKHATMATQGVIPAAGGRVVNAVMRGLGRLHKSQNEARDARGMWQAGSPKRTGVDHSGAHTFVGGVLGGLTASHFLSKNPKIGVPLWAAGTVAGAIGGRYDARALHGRYGPKGSKVRKAEARDDHGEWTAGDAPQKLHQVGGRMASKIARSNALQAENDHDFGRVGSQFFTRLAAKIASKVKKDLVAGDAHISTALGQQASRQKRKPPLSLARMPNRDC